MFVRDNCILPLADPVEHVDHAQVFVIRPKVYGNGQEGCVLYEDDFETFDYEQGKQNKVKLSVDSAGKVQAHRSGGERARYEIVCP